MKEINKDRVATAKTRLTMYIERARSIDRVIRLWEHANKINHVFLKHNVKRFKPEKVQIIPFYLVLKENKIWQENREKRKEQIKLRLTPVCSNTRLLLDANRSFFFKKQLCDFHSVIKILPEYYKEIEL